MFDKYKCKYRIYRLLCNISFGKMREKFFQKKLKYKKRIYPQLNIYTPASRVNVEGDNNIFDREKIIANNIELQIFGNNNEIKLDFDTIQGDRKHLRINIHGDNNQIEIGNELKIYEYLFIDLAYPPHKINNAVVQIGNNFSVVNMEVMLLDNGSKLKIGDDCMFSQYIITRLSDTHSVLDLEGNLLNHGGFVEIGNRVWCGRDVRILKNVSVADDSIIGASSVVTKRFKETNVAIGGNPAKIIKRGVCWNKLTPQKYLDLQNSQKELV